MSVMDYPLLNGIVLLIFTFTFCFLDSRKDSNDSFLKIISFPIIISVIVYIPLYFILVSINQRDIQGNYTRELSEAKDYSPEFQSLLKKAYFDDESQARIKIAHMYYFGNGVHKDVSKSYDWYKYSKSFDGQYSAFQIILKNEITDSADHHFFSGHNFRSEEEEKFKEYFSNFSQNKLNEDISQKLLLIAEVYLKQNAKNDGIAIILNLAKNNYFPAQKYLGDLYSQGNTVIRDPAKAYAWYLVSNANNFSTSNYEKIINLKKELFIKKENDFEFQLAEKCAQRFSKENDLTCFNEI